MQQWVYLIALLVSLGGLATLDWRYRLAFWSDAARSVRVLGVSVVVFLIWDAAGIALGIFRHAGGAFTLPVRLAPEFPIEELLFLAVLCYSALLLYRVRWTWG